MHPEHQQQRPLVKVRAHATGPKCPFGNQNGMVAFTVVPGGCVWLQGPSGRGKTTIAMHVAGLLADVDDSRHVHVDCDWDPTISPTERCGVLFQQTALLDELTVAGNLAVALRSAGGGRGRNSRISDKYDDDALCLRKIKQLLETVGLDYARDSHKRPTELSGGMARRAGTALQLAQRKHVIILDEPFAGLDHDAALSVAKELVHLRQSQGTALILIAHEPDIAQAVLADGVCHGNVLVSLTEPTLQKESTQNRILKPSLFGTHFRDRFLEKLIDYIMYSLPLILLTFCATGMAIAMLSADSLSRMNVTEPVLKIVDQEVRPMIQMLTGAEPNALHLLGVRFKVQQMLHRTVPPAKAILYATGMAKLFVLEIGPLLTALLLSGRIGGSYAGAVATMRATSQTQLLQTLGISPVAWSLYPAAAAALIAGPILTLVGTAVSLYLAGWIGPLYGIGTNSDYWTQVQSSILPVLRLQGFSVPSFSDDSTNESTTAMQPPPAIYHTDYYRTTFSPYWTDAVIEVVTYPTIYAVLKASVFMGIILGTAEVCARYGHSNLTSRNVPGVIASLLVILADWGFSRLWLQRR